MAIHFSTMQDWKDRAHSIHLRGTHLVHLLSTKCVLTAIRVEHVTDIPALMWTDNANERTEYMKWSMHPSDCDNLILRDGNRCVYMNYKSTEQSSSQNVNIPATRLLLERGTVDPPMIVDGTSAIDYTGIFPCDHVVLHQTINGRLCDYDLTQVTTDWQSMFTVPLSRQPYYRLATRRYVHFSQALAEYQYTDTMDGLVEHIIAAYVRQRVGPVSAWDACQLAVLGAAMYLMHRNTWHECEKPLKVCNMFTQSRSTRQTAARGRSSDPTAQLAAPIHCPPAP